MAPHFKRGRVQDEADSGPILKRARQESKPARRPRESKSLKTSSQAVSADSLTWKEVALPDHLDDFEGFYGLEEIEGVDVVRAEQKGKIEFLVSILPWSDMMLIEY
jgi:ATP-dependent RNA helicase DDX24/MAK5